MPRRPELAELSGQIEAIELSSSPRRINLNASEQAAIEAIRRRQRALAPRYRRPASNQRSTRLSWIVALTLILGITLWFI
jgi:hypothetical protein